MTIQEMKDRKRELGLSNEEISRLSHIPVGTLQKIFSGTTSSPRQKTIQALEAVLAYPGVTYDRNSERQQFYGVQDVVSSYAAKKQGQYTIDDYLTLPEDERYELIDGILYNMASPSFLHQFVLTELLSQLLSCKTAHNIPCYIVPAPCDVQLDNDSRTMVQPDIVVCCRQGKISRQRIVGAPDFIVEIISPGTRKKDMTLKYNKYSEAGVHEYWLVDPDNQQVLVYHLWDDSFPSLYGFDSKVPVRISEGRCEIDFSRIKEEMGNIP